MNTIKSTSGINSLERNKPLSEWAVEFIQRHSLSQNSFGEAEVFRSLARREKDAVRYQMKKRKATRGVGSKDRSIKNTAKKSSNVPSSFDWLKFVKIALSVWISTFLLFDIVGIYLDKGASLPMAWQAAILVEICIIGASMSQRDELRRVAYALFFYNVLLFGFMEFNSVSQQLSVLSLNRAKIIEKESQKAVLQKQLIEQQNASSHSIRQLQLDHRRGYVTSGTNAFESVSSTLNANIAKLRDNLESIEKEMITLSSSTDKKCTVWLVSILYFLMRCLLQLFSIQLLRKRHM